MYVVVYCEFATDTACSAEQLKNPSADHVSKVFELLLEQLVGWTADSALPPFDLLVEV